MDPIDANHEQQPPTIGQVVERYTACWRQGDFEGARAMAREDAVHHVRTERETSDLVGHDAVLEFYARRRRTRPTASWHLGAQNIGAHHVSLVSRLRDSTGQGWEMLSVYRVVDGRIAEVWHHEPF